jgi:hypothetical protein
VTRCATSTRSVCFGLCQRGFRASTRHAAPRGAENHLPHRNRSHSYTTTRSASWSRRAQYFRPSSMWSEPLCAIASRARRLPCRSRSGGSDEASVIAFTGACARTMSAETPSWGKAPGLGNRGGYSPPWRKRFPALSGPLGVAADVVACVDARTAPSLRSAVECRDTNLALR